MERTVYATGAVPQHCHSSLWHFMLLFWVIFFAMGTSTAQHVNSTYDEYARRAKSWCTRIRDTPEPWLIVYNRIPKCGSSSLERIFDHQKRVSRHRIVAWHTPMQYMGPFHNDATQKFYATLAKRRSQFGRGAFHVVDGHWSFREIPRNLTTKVEYIQMYRECRGQAKSAALWEMVNGVPRSARRNPDKLKDYLSTRGLNIPAKECIEDINCLQRIHLGNVKKGIVTRQYFCGDPCAPGATGNHSAWDVAISRLRGDNPGVRGVYSIVGVTELFEEYLEVLQCLYPSVFDGVVKWFRKQGMYANKSKFSGGTAALEQYAAGICADGDELLYDEIRKEFEAKYSIMKRHPGGCCRKKQRPKAFWEGWGIRH